MSAAMENLSDIEFKEPTILIIDDDPKNLALMTNLLEGSHFETLVAEDGESGIKRAQYAGPDLILLDILMPGMDGYETCRRLKAMESTRDIPVIIMTALMESEHKIMGFRAGAVDYITKPFQREEVLARVGIHLHNRELTIRLRKEKELLEKRVEERTAELAQKNLFLEQEIAERSRLEREIINVSEEERRRISHDLHDGLCQLLIGARLHFSTLRRKLAGTGVQQPDLSQLASLLEDSVNMAYNLSHGLWPVEHSPHGIVPSLEDFTRRLGLSSGIAIEFRHKRGCSKCANASVTQLFRIAQEAITNAIKHAGPSRIVVELDCADRKTISLTVRDDGVGRADDFRKKGGLGLRIMAYRARLIDGVLTMSDGVDGGTIVTCTAPCENHLTEDSNKK